MTTLISFVTKSVNPRQKIPGIRNGLSLSVRLIGRGAPGVLEYERVHVGSGIFDDGICSLYREHSATRTLPNV